MHNIYQKICLISCYVTFKYFYYVYAYCVSEYIAKNILKIAYVWLLVKVDIVLCPYRENKQTDGLH